MGKAEAGPRRTRRRWSEEEKRVIVTETGLPGASLAAVARQHDLNANQLFGWRRQFSSDGQPEASVEPQFVPVEVSGGFPNTHATADIPELPRPRKPDRRQGIIEIEFPSGVRLRCDQHVDRQALALVVDVLMARA
ncbi:transposase [Dongia soli]|uniref:Transposase n=1 Tax=Dongia soli TaxID=600628 RepID=A0ABU5EDG3_9PROT|nr:transposase [Dongia soli]MDY0883595.1 transposase [Dongia soli]